MLWLFGFFALFWAGKGLDIEVFFSNAKLLGQSFSPFSPAFWDFNWIQLEELVAMQTASAMLFGVFVFIALFALVMVMLSQVALVDAYALFANKKKGKQVYTLDQAMKAGEKHVVSVLVVNVVGRLVSYGLLGVASSPLFLARFVDSQFLFSLLLFLIVTPIAVLISLLTKYAVNFIVLKNQKIVESVFSAWKLFVENVGVSIEMAILMFVVYFTVNVTAIFVSIIVTLPILLFGLILVATIGSVMGLFIYYFIVYALAVVIMIFSAALFSAWHYGNWTLLFLDITQAKRRSKTHRLLRG